MSVACEIDFENNPNKIIYTGQVVRGTVRLTLNEEKNVRGVYIRIYGKAYCRWTRRRGRVTYVGKQNYLNETTYLIGAEEGNVRLNRGLHTYNFQCNLPAHLPTSVEGKIGYIRYTACVTIDIPMALDYDFKQRFTVIRPVNLNSNPAMRRSVVSPSNEYSCFNLLCCCCCIVMRPIEVSAQIPVGGYTPGQMINLELHVKHKGSRKHYEFTVNLIKRIDYFANKTGILGCCTRRGHTKEEHSVIGKEVNCRIANSNTVEVVRVNLEVPPVSPTDYSSSTVVKVTYYLSIESSTGCCNGSPTNKVGMVIGTYPIEDFPVPNSNLEPPTAPLLDSMSGNATNKELPTYEEAMDMVDGRVVAGGDNFKPKYPVFKRQTSYSNLH